MNRAGQSLVDCRCAAVSTVRADLSPAIRPGRSVHVHFQWMDCIGRKKASGLLPGEPCLAHVVENALALQQFHQRRLQPLAIAMAETGGCGRGHGVPFDRAG